MAAMNALYNIVTVAMVVAIGIFIACISALLLDALTR